MAITAGMKSYDLIIVGGGLVGASLALALRDCHFKLALIDARLPIHSDPRLLALNRLSCQFLKNLGLWQALLQHVAPIQEVHVSYQGHFGSVRLQDDIHQLELGCVIPACMIEAALYDALNKQKNLEIFCPAKLEALINKKDINILHVDSNQQKEVLSAPIVIAADGSDSTIRAQLQCKTNVFNYQQKAIVTKTLLQRSHKHIAYERFTANGAIAMLPLVASAEGHQCATIWTADNHVIAELAALSDADFISALQKEFGYRLGRIQKIQQRYQFPLRKIIAEKTVHQGVFLLGNSAHTLHPIAAQGLNLALYEVAVLVSAIMEKQAQLKSFTKEDLHTVNTKIENQQSMNIGLSHRLSRLFTPKSSLMRMALQLGLVSFDLMTPLKRKFIHQIMGKRDVFQVTHTATEL